MRKPRQIIPGATYHVVARANRQEFIFENPNIRDLLLDVVHRASQKYRFDLVNFCIMSNHVHLMIRPIDGSSLSRIMQWILGVFAGIYNRLFGLKGHVWYDRFRSRVITSFRQWVATFAYILENPIRAGVAKRPDTYRASGAYHMLHRDYSIIDTPQSHIQLLFPELASGLLLAPP